MSGLLEGMRVLDAGIWRPVPHATQILADLGAEVLKLEPPGGDPMRGFPELFRDIASNKRSVVLDLKTDAGRARALELAAGADVFCEGWRPGVAARLGVAYDNVRAVNPSIIYCSISGYGQWGPLLGVTGHDVNYQAFAGALAPRAPDEPPRIPRVPIADLAAGTAAATLICAAWSRRIATGEGERIDVAMADVIAAWTGPYSGNAMAGRTERARGSTGYGTYRCADGAWLAFGVIAEDHLWAALCDGLGLVELRDLAHHARLDRFDECDAAIAAACSARPRDELYSALVASGAPVALVLTPAEMGRHPQFVERGVVVHEADGPRVGFAGVLDVHPARPPGPVPEPGEHDGWA